MGNELSNYPAQSYPMNYQFPFTKLPINKLLFSKLKDLFIFRMYDVPNTHNKISRPYGTLGNHHLKILKFVEN